MELYKAAQGLADILRLGTVSSIEADKLNDDERGWSGAEVVRRKVFFSNGTSTSMIFKTADRKERCAMQHLTQQGHGYTPASCSDDLLSDEPGWMAMQDLGQPKAVVVDDHWLGKVAEALAAIHAGNMGRCSEMPWLPVVDEAYWNRVVSDISLSHFEKKLALDPRFEREFGKYLPRLQEIGKTFAYDMAALSREDAYLTLTHGDLQMRDGAHIYNCEGNPCLIDFGFCRYAPFYIDLAGWFSAETLPIYYKAISQAGIGLRYADFEERARAAFRYNGFIYMYPSLIDWQEGPTERTGKRLLQALKIILSGDFPDRRTKYADGLFQELVEEHHSYG